MSGAGTGQRGRRPGAPDTRGQILEAARESFAAKGFRSTTIRAVAADAGVDAALVHHYFGTKDDLFVASLEIPIDPRSAIAEVFAAGLEGAGERLLATVLAVWDQPEGRRPLVALVRSSLGDPESTLLQEGLVRVVFTALQDQLGEDAEVRAGLVAITGRAYIASKKQSGGGLYQGPEALSPTGVNTFKRIADVPWVTDGAFSPDGRRLVLRGYFGSDLYAWDGTPKKLRSLDVPFQRQGESVTFSADGTAVLYGSEGSDSDVWRLRLTQDAAPAPSGSPAAAPSGGAQTSSGRAAGSGSGSGGGTDHALAALIAVAAAIGLAKLWSGRRKGN